MKLYKKDLFLAILFAISVFYAISGFASLKSYIFERQSVVKRYNYLVSKSNELDEEIEKLKIKTKAIKEENLNKDVLEASIKNRLGFFYKDEIVLYY